MRVEREISKPCSWVQGGESLWSMGCKGERKSPLRVIQRLRVGMMAGMIERLSARFMNRVMIAGVSNRGAAPKPPFGKRCGTTAHILRSLLTWLAPRLVNSVLSAIRR